MPFIDKPIAMNELKAVAKRNLENILRLWM